MSYELSLALVLACVLAPVALGAIPSGLLRTSGPRASRWAAGAAAGSALAALMLAGLTLAGLALPGTVGAGPIGLQIDRLTVPMLATVALIGAVVARYAVRHLDGDGRQAAFSRWLSLALSGALLAIASGGLVVFLAATVATGFALHRLLCHDPGRPLVVQAARQRFWLARLGDALLLAACVLAYRELGTVGFEGMAARAEVLASTAGASGAVGWIALLLVGWALIQSAALPFHDWLPNTMGAPTPVSALMHAGIINAGGFLLIRSSPLLVHAPGALAALAFVGAVTAVVAAAIMLTQTEIKAKYAYSTISQFGFMLLQCGLGAFGVATLHLIGHSFYKGHAFLTASSAVDPEPAVEARGPVHGPVAPPAPARWPRAIAAVLAGFAVVVGVELALDIDPAGMPGALVLHPVLALAIGQVLLLGWGHGANATGEPGLVARLRLDLVLASVAIAVVYLVGAGLLRETLGQAIPAVAATPAVPLALAVAILGLFVAAAALQIAVASGARSDAASRLWLRIYVHVRQGLYLGAIGARLANARTGGLAVAPASHSSNEGAASR